MPGGLPTCSAGRSLPYLGEDLPESTTNWHHASLDGASLVWPASMRTTFSPGCRTKVSSCLTSMVLPVPPCDATWPSVYTNSIWSTIVERRCNIEGNCAFWGCGSSDVRTRISRTVLAAPRLASRLHSRMCPPQRALASRFRRRFRGSSSSVRHSSSAAMAKRIAWCSSAASASFMIGQRTF
jgi:hypothetical protein